MPRPAFARSLALLAGTALLTLGGTTAASAAPKLAGTPSATSTLAAAAAEPPWQQCRALITTYGATCFQWVGDNQWVEDRDENGWATVVHVQTNYGKDRYCQALPAAEGWAYCSYDHREGKCVRFMMYEAKGNETRHQTAWSPWYGTEYGSPC